MKPLEEELLQMIAQKKYAAAKTELMEWNEADVAALMEDIPDKDALQMFRLLPKDMAADVFAFLPIPTQQEMIASLTDEETNHIIENMYADDAADLLEEMPANVVTRILAAARKTTRTEINRLLQYPDGSAGAIMTVEYISLKEDWTVDMCLKQIRRIGDKSESSNVCYVLSTTRKLTGTVTLKELIFHDSETQVQEFMEDRPIAVHANDDQEEVSQIFQKYDFSMMPVVDSENRMVGIITADDIMDVIEQEATEDMTKMAAVTPQNKLYVNTTVLEEVRRRAPWLLLLMISATFSGAIITFFEDQLAASLVLAAFIPMLMDTGGNAGGQSSTMIIRALSLNEFQFKESFRIVWKEFRIALLCGIILAAVNYVKMMLLDRTGAMVALVVCITLIVTVIFAKLLGAILPIMANRIGMDPAVMANPIITTIVDAISLLIYFRFAVALLGL